MNDTSAVSGMRRAVVGSLHIEGTPTPVQLDIRPDRRQTMTAAAPAMTARRLGGE